MIEYQSEIPVGGPNEAIGLVFPIFYLGMPRLVKSFVERLNIIPETYCFAVINYRGFGGNTLGILDELLRKKDVALSYTDEIKMPGSFIVNSNTPASEIIDKRLADCEFITESIAKSIAKCETKAVQGKAALISKFINRRLYKDVAKWDEKFISDSSCTSCGLCVKVCPVGNIKIVEGHPVWQHNCERCLACIHWCPQRAIQYGEKTIKRGRYQNPNIKCNDIIEGRK